NKDAKNFRVATAPEANVSPKNWKPFLAHQNEVLLSDIDVFRNFAVAVETTEAVNRLRVYDFKTAKWSAISFPEPVYSAFPGITPDFDSTTYRYTYQSFLTPSSVFDYDTRSGESKLLKQQEVLGGYDRKQYMSERLWATARDG